MKSFVHLWGISAWRWHSRQPDRFALCRSPDDMVCDAGIRLLWSGGDVRLQGWFV